MAEKAFSLLNMLFIELPLVHTAAGDVVMGNSGVCVVNKAVGAVTQVTLKARATRGMFAFVKDGLGDAATNNITVIPDATTNNTTIDGAANYVIAENFGSALFMHNGTEWGIMAAGLPVSAAELAFLNGITAGTAAASKALVLDSSSRLGTVAELAVTTPIIGQGAPAAETGAATITIADILTGLVTITHTVGATVALTLDTGSAMDTGKPNKLGTGQAIDWSIINLSAAALDTATLTASSGHTIVGNPIVQSAHASTGELYGSSARFRSRRTAANTWVTYRLS